MPPPAPALAGVILAGGRAVRMAGADKALLPLAGRPLLAHVVARLAPQVGALAISANGDPARFAAFGLPVLADPLPGFPGPLAGILAGMDWAAAAGAGLLLSAAGDTPFLPLDLATRLGAVPPPAMAAAPAEDRHPTFALWPTALRHELRAALAAGQRKVAAFADAHGAATVAFPDPLAFLNVNTPADLARAAQRAGA